MNSNKGSMPIEPINKIKIVAIKKVVKYKSGEVIEE